MDGDGGCPQASATAARPLFDRLSDGWQARAQVRIHVLGAGTPFEPDRPDFVESLLPFARHPRYRAASPELRAATLSCGWLLFNQKQVELERCIVIPACLELLRGRLPGGSDLKAQKVLSEALTDESYHILLTEHASEVTRRQRGLGAIELPTCRVVREFEAEQARHADAGRRNLLLLAAAIVTEVFICGFLRSLSEADAIQPLHVRVTRTHLADELTHACVFRSIMTSGYHEMTLAERDAFALALALAMRWLAAPEIDTWAAVLRQLGFAYVDDIVGETPWRSPTPDYAPLLRICNELGLSSIRERLARVVL